MRERIEQLECRSCHDRDIENYGLCSYECDSPMDYIERYDGIPEDYENDYCRFVLLEVVGLVPRHRLAR